MEIRQAIQQIAGDLSCLFSDSYLSILLVGAAARDEISLGPEGAVLSDLDFLIVLPQRQRVWALIREYQARRKFRAAQQALFEKYPVPISVGFANAAANYWLMATPFMYELRENGQVLFGAQAVKSWPAIKQNDQIPMWEGIRLVANRLCELLGSAGDETKDQSIWTYASLKLFLACSEAHLIELHLYQPSYRQRYTEYMRSANDFSQDQNVFISSAYRAKLGLDREFYQYNTETLFRHAIAAGIAYLSKYGLVSPLAWARRCQLETNGNDGLTADLLFFVRNLAKGSIVNFRQPIASIYSRAFTIATALNQNNGRLTGMPDLKQSCADLYKQYGITPQLVSILRPKHP
jgi:hypothetical protein